MAPPPRLLTVSVLVVLLAIPSGANYCVCNSGLSDSVLQKNIDYACGHGADCSAIQPNGACYNPNTVKDHCSYAVNSYFQKKGQISGSCDFQGTATVTPNPPTGTGTGGCVFQSSPSAGGTTPTTPTPPSTGGTTAPPTSPTIGGTPTTPSTGGTPPTNPAGGTPTTPTTGGMTSPSTSPGTPTTGGGTSTPGVFPGTTSPGGLGLTPTGSPFSSTDSSVDVKLSTATLMVMSVVTLVAYDFIHPRM